MGKHKAAPSKATISNSKPAPPQSSLSWPSFAPPSDPLEFDVIIPQQLLVIRDFLDPITLKSFRSFTSSDQMNILQRSPAVPKKGEALRTNDRLSVEDPSFAERLWKDTGLEELCLRHEWNLNPFPGKGKQPPVPKGLLSNIRLYRYSIGQLFAKHYDDDFTSPLFPNCKSKYTLLIYLTGMEDGLEGGETIFYPEGGGESHSIRPERGMALLHRHGAECMLHEGAPVKKGTKWVLRSDVMFG